MPCPDCGGLMISQGKEKTFIYRKRGRGYQKIPVEMTVLMCIYCGSSEYVEDD